MSWDEKGGFDERGWRVSRALVKPEFNLAGYVQKFLWTPTHQVISARPEYGPPPPHRPSGRDSNRGQAGARQSLET